jgi:plasmid stabilization system protein ParE
MAAEMIRTKSSLADLEGIAGFVGRDSPHFAVLTVERIVKAAERLAELPESGRIVPEYDGCVALSAGGVASPLRGRRGCRWSLVSCVGH